MNSKLIAIKKLQTKDLVSAIDGDSNQGTLN